MPYILISIPVAIAIVDWFLVYNQSKSEYFAKPGTMVSLIAWVVFAAVTSDTVFPWGGLIWFVIGAVASTSGDIFLMLPGDYFLAGLLSFAFAHIAYIIGLSFYGFEGNLAGGIVTALVLGVGVRIFRRLTVGIRTNHNPKLIGPVLFYVLVISIMVILALFTLTGSRWQTGPALLISLGALSFFVSDTLLGWDRFVTPIKFARVKVMITYHLGQLGIIVGAVIQFL